MTKSTDHMNKMELFEHNTTFFGNLIDLLISLIIKSYSLSKSIILNWYINKKINQFSKKQRGNENV